MGGNVSVSNAVVETVQKVVNNVTSSNQEVCSNSLTNSQNISLGNISASGGCTVNIKDISQYQSIVSQQKCIQTGSNDAKMLSDFQAQIQTAMNDTTKGTQIGNLNFSDQSSAQKALSDIHNQFNMSNYSQCYNSAMNQQQISIGDLVCSGGSTINAEDLNQKMGVNAANTCLQQQADAIFGAAAAGVVQKAADSVSNTGTDLTAIFQTLFSTPTVIAVCIVVVIVIGGLCMAGGMKASAAKAGMSMQELYGKGIPAVPVAQEVTKAEFGKARRGKKGVAVPLGPILITIGVLVVIALIIVVAIAATEGFQNGGINDTARSIEQAAEVANFINSQPAKSFRDFQLKLIYDGIDRKYDNETLYDRLYATRPLTSAAVTISSAL